jgi:hypothetical protein
MIKKFIKKNNFLNLQKRFGWSIAGPRELDSIIKVNLLEKEYPERIAEIWNSNHLMKMDMMSDVISTETYSLLSNRLKKYPMFVIPIHKKFGYGNFCL